MAAKSLALSLVNSWPATLIPAACAWRLNSVAIPVPKAVRSSITPTFLSFSSLAA